MVRRDWKSTAAVGVSTGDYSQWTFVDSNMQVGGPTLLALPDGRILAGSRLYLADGMHTALSWLDPGTGSLNPFIVFPRGPDLQDTGYPGLYYDARITMSG